MSEAQQAANVLGFDIDAMMIALSLAVQAFFVLFFVISPIAGMLMGQVIKKRSSLVVMTMLSLLTFNLTFVGVLYFLNGETLSDTFTDSSQLIIGLAAAFVVALFTLYGSAMFLAEPEKMTENITQMQDSRTADFGFQQRRMERLKKRGKR